VILPEEKPALDALEHHGVKGMKWGVHRSKGPGWVARTGVNSSKKRRTAAAAVRVSRAAGKGTVNATRAVSSSRAGRIAGGAVMTVAGAMLLSEMMRVSYTDVPASFYTSFNGVPYASLL
jgi:hypothetical protein